VRAELGRRLTLRYLPEVIFKKDVSGLRGDRVLKLLEELHIDAQLGDAPAPSNLPDTTASGS
jgi:ribosome-binding factor A